MAARGCGVVGERAAETEVGAAAVTVGVRASRLEAVDELICDVRAVHEEARAQPQHAGDSALSQRGRRRRCTPDDPCHLLAQQRQQHLQHSPEAHSYVPQHP